MKECVLFSGGMDSFLAWKLFAPKAVLLFIDIQQPYFLKELRAVTDVAKASFVEPMRIKAAPIGKQEVSNGIILHRNAHLILGAASFYPRIMLGVVADEINSDKSVEFFSAMETMLNISHRGQYWNNEVGVEYKIWSPVRNYSKSELVAKYLERQGDKNTLLETISCYSSEYGHCGACPSCFKRWVALTNNGLSQAFANNPVAWATHQGIIEKANNGTYAPKRANEILQAISK